MSKASIEVKDNPEERRYEAHIDGHTALVQYERRGDSIIFLHTEVPTALEGQGVGSALARAVLDDARVRKLTVVPLCPFISAYIQRHQEYLDVVDSALRAKLKSATD